MMQRSGFGSEAYNYAQPYYKKIYPEYFDIRDEAPGRDLRLFEQTYEDTALEIGRAQHQRMQSILAYFRTRYLDGPQADRSVVKLAYSVRAWLPYVSYSNFIYLRKKNDLTSPTPPVQDLPSVDELKAGSPILRGEAIATMEDEYNELLVPERNERYVKWRKDVSSATDARTLSRVSLSSVPEYLPGEELRHRLYARDPVLILLPAVANPHQLEAILSLPFEDRGAQLQRLVKAATYKLQVAADKFGKDLRKSEIPWGRYQPLLAAAKFELCPVWSRGGLEEEKVLAMHELLDSFAGNLSPWSTGDTINAVVIGLSVGLTIATMGTALPVAVTMVAGVSIDFAAMGWLVYEKHLENLERDKRNSFAHVDASLTVASPEMNLLTEALFLGASYLVGPLVGSTFRMGKKVVVGVLRKNPVSQTLSGQVIKKGAGGIDNVARSLVDETDQLSATVVLRGMAERGVTSRSVDDLSRATNPGKKVVRTRAEGLQARSTSEPATVRRNADGLDADRSKVPKGALSRDLTPPPPNAAEPPQLRAAPKPDGQALAEASRMPGWHPEAITDTSRLLNGSLRPGRVVPNLTRGVGDKELKQMERILDLRGGRIVGETRKSQAGVDGALRDSLGKVTIISLKELEPAGSIVKILKHANQAEKKALKAGYTANVEVFLDARYFAKVDIIDFAKGGEQSLLQIAHRNEPISHIYIHAKDGWLVISKSAAGEFRPAP